MGRLNLNCDLGENEPLAQTERLLQLVDAANVCCGVHAGSLEKTQETLRLAQKYGVVVGAHPGLASSGGRGVDLPSAAQFRVLLEAQLGNFFKAAEDLGVPVHHVKLHGSLYMAVERDVDLANVYLEQLMSFGNPLVFALSGGVFAKKATAQGLRVSAELFVDRAYQADGSLLPRTEQGALIESVDEAVGRMRVWLGSGRMQTVSGELLSLMGDTMCVHSDSPNSIELLVGLRDL